MKTLFYEAADADKVREGTIACIEAVFQASSSTAIKHKFFDTACWLVSERNGKWNSRYRSEASLTADKATLRHEHVIPRASLWFVGRRSLSARDALMMCEGCVVTEDEHRKLHAVEEGYSWDRYVKAGITVIDMKTEQTLLAEKLLEMGEPFFKAFREARFIGDGEEELEMMNKPMPPE